MKSKRIRQWLSILMAAALTLGSPVIPIDTAVTAQAAEAVILAESDEREVNFNKDWKFFLDENGEDENAAIDASAKDYNDSSWKDVNLPHDFAISEEFSNEYEAESGFLPGGTGWYRKTVVFPASYDGKSVILNFDGVYNNAYVYINGTKIGEHHYGYTNFSFDISDLIICDGAKENVIAVKAVSEFPSSRWYSGAGINRNVTLTVVDPVHVSLNGTYVTTPNLETQKDGDVTVNAVTTMQNDGNTPVSASVSTTIEDAKGKVVSKTAVENTLDISAGASIDQKQEIIVNKPNLWDCDNPALYYVKTEISVGGKVVDTYKTKFGFRYFNYDADTGFSLNGKKTKLKGVCIHHDQGALGSVDSYDAISRQVRILKEMGCNSIRTSHNAFAKVFLDVCNEQGILVMDEVFDGWAYPKNRNVNDFSKYFNTPLGSGNALIGGQEDEKWYQFALKSFINRDKNDPCVVSWSLGNEINFGVGGADNGLTTNQTYVDEYKGYASDMIQIIQNIDRTKPITHGDNNAAGTADDLRTQVDYLLAESGGLVGLNYSPGSYANNHKNHPTWRLVGTETVSAINSRGIYTTTSEYSKPGDYQNTAYDTHAVSWGQTARQAWLPIIQNDCMSGTYVWTGFDYIGEPTNWNGLTPGSASGDTEAIPNSSYFGIIDTAGFPKDSFYFYTSQWREDKTTLHIVPGCWNEEDLMVSNDRVKVDLYSNAAKVELLLNGEVIGTATRDELTTDAGYKYGMYRTTSNNVQKCTASNSTSNSDYNNMAAQFYVSYEAGTLSAKAYDEDQNEITDTIGIKTVKTNSDKGSFLKVTPEKTTIQADGSSLAYISVDILDKNGEFVSQADNLIRFSLTGNGEIAGVDNGNPSTIRKFQQASVLPSTKSANINAFSGKALIIVRSTDTAGGFSLRAESSGMKAQTVEIDTTGSTSGETYLKRYEFQTDYTVDMGTPPVLEKNAVCFMSDNTTLNASLTWDDVTEDMYKNPGDYQIDGVMEFQGKQLPVTSFLHVNPIIVSVKNCSKATLPNIKPTMPETVSGILPDGRIYGNYSVTWESVSDEDFSTVGDIITVNGTASVSDTLKHPVKLTIRVAEPVSTTQKNIAPECTALTQTSIPEADNLRAIIDGNTDLESATGSGEAANKRWTNWNSALTTGAKITFKWNDIHSIDHVILYHYSDSSVELPASVEFSYFDGNETKVLTENDLTATEIDKNNNNKATYTFHTPFNASSLSIAFTGRRKNDNPNNPPYVGLVECQIYNTGTTYNVNDTAVLNALTINGVPVTGFTAGEHSQTVYEMNINGRINNAAITANAADNASVSVIPADTDGTFRVIVQSENSATLNTYTIHLNSEEEDAVKDLEPDINNAFSESEKKVQSAYTTDSWNALQAALSRLKDAQKNGTAEEVRNALTAVNTAISNLKENTYVTDQDMFLLPTGKIYPADDKTADYQIVTSTPGGGTVTFVKPAKKTNTKFIVPDTVKIQGHTYTVTKIANNAFKNNKKLKTVTIGKNITEIGKSAFAGDKKLKTIKIQSTVLTNVGKKAFKGIADKAKIKVPKSKKKQYKKILKGRGQKSSVKIS